MQQAAQSTSTISVVVVVYNIPREIPRTLLSLSASYQRHIRADEYEIIVVDNGSTPPVDPKMLDGLDGNFRLIRMDPASPSPARAINRGLREAKGDVIGVMIDGARIVTPGLLHFARHGASLFPRAVVATLGWYLGADVQKFAVEAGYSIEEEDALLASIAWPAEGYRLFDIATPDESSVDGWLRTIVESNALFLSRDTWRAMDGVDEAFDFPGGGLLNPDTFKRAMELEGSELVLLLGEATFHQLHGGVATNSQLESFVDAVELWHVQYAELRGERFKPPSPQHRRSYIGTLPTGALFQLVSAAVHPIRGRKNPPVGRTFDRDRWSLTKSAAPVNSKVAALVKLAQKEFTAGRLEACAAVARLARRHAPAEPEPQRLLRQIGPALLRRIPTDDYPDFHAALGEAYSFLGDREKAATEFAAALRLDSKSNRSYVGLSMLRMPGDGYLLWLRRFHELLRPASYVEIGVNQGLSLSLAKPPTRAIGVDPAADIRVRFRAETHVFPETSDEFFAQGRLRELLRDQPLTLGFIDGLHLFEQALRDFINLEPYCTRQSVILFHDTLPLDESAQSRERTMNFHTGDVWKAIVCLKHYRAELNIFTIAAPWSGLTVVTNLDPKSRTLEVNYSAAVERFMNMPFSTIQQGLDAALNLVPNDWETVAQRLSGRADVVQTAETNAL